MQHFVVNVRICDLRINHKKCADLRFALIGILRICNSKTSPRICDLEFVLVIDGLLFQFVAPYFDSAWSKVGPVEIYELGEGGGKGFLSNK